MEYIYIYIIYFKGMVNWQVKQAMNTWSSQKSIITHARVCLYVHLYVLVTNAIHWVAIKDVRKLRES